jgi:vacuolar protein 8
LTSTQTIVQLLEAEDEQLTANIRSSPMLLAQIRELAEKSPGSDAGESPSRGRRGSISDDDDVSAEGGAGEIASLSRRILDLTDGGRTIEGGAEGGGGGEHAALRASVHQALNGQQY